LVLKFSVPATRACEADLSFGHNAAITQVLR
jgi:hypothetical protein